jgi:hypothetical protein
VFINRITFSLNKNHFNNGVLKQFKEEQIKIFDQLTNLFEEILLFHLPKRTNLGGYGFFNNKLVSERSKPSINTSGQCIEFYHYLDIDKLEDLVNSSSNNQLIKLSELLKSAVIEISKVHIVDTDIFLSAIDKLLGSTFGFEQRLKVSKSHKSKKVKIDVIRKVELSTEYILYRIKNENGDSLFESILEHDTSIYDSSYSYKKSKWHENNLEIFDRFNKVHKTINVDKYL